MSKTRTPGHPFLWVVMTPVFSALLGSAFNIWYNVVHIEPLLSPAEETRFQFVVVVYNLTVYPLLIAYWTWRVLSLRSVFRLLEDGETVDPERLEKAQARTINLPWTIVGVHAFGWFSCIPIFLGFVAAVPGELHSGVLIHLPTSFVLGALTCITHGFFAVEIAVQHQLFPTMFRDSKPCDTHGAWTLPLRTRGLWWTLSAGVCPLLSVLLIVLARDDFQLSRSWFELSVGGLGIAFGLFGANLLGRLVVTPVDALRVASQRVAAGDLDTRVDLLRADEFGPLVDEFNRMVGEMREKEKLREVFGAHVGVDAAHAILSGDRGLGGRVGEVSVLFCDIRGFTAHAAENSPEEVVTLLNCFFETCVTIVESDCGGMVNKFLGDGFMALFGATCENQNHAQQAVDAGLEILRCFDQEDDGESAALRVGVGIHTGEAVVGSIGSPRRMEYTAIGDVVNIASRLESQTKDEAAAMIASGETYDRLDNQEVLSLLGERELRGQPQAIRVYVPTINP